MRTITTLLLALVTLVAPAATAAAQQGEETGYETDVSEDKASIEIERTLDEREATTEITFDTDKGHFEATFDYENATTEAESKLEVALHQLVEYKDTNENGRYDADDDVASAWKVANGSRNVSAESNGTLQWRPLETENVTADDGTEGTLISGEARFPAQDPIAGVLEQLGQGENRTFAIDMYVFGEPVTLDGNDVGAMEVKIDFRVTNYPYTKNGTALALISETKSEQEVELEENASRAAVEQRLEGLSVDLSFAWSDDATVDGETTTVETTTLEETSESESEEDEASSVHERVLAFSYERGDEIVHDPTLGASAQAADGDLIGQARDRANDVPGLSAWAAVLGAVGAVGLARTRQG